MPIHDWTRVDEGLFHNFHLSWACSLSTAFNAGGLPGDYFALLERRVAPSLDLLTLDLPQSSAEPDDGCCGIAVDTQPPRTRLIRRTNCAVYAAKANRITVRHQDGDVVAVIEIVSPGNKGSGAEFKAFVEKSVEIIRQGVNVLVIDLFPPSQRDPQGIHKAIWDQFEEDEFELPQDKSLTVASYDAGPEKVAYVEFIAAGESLPEIPLFLRPGYYVPAPLESSYQTAWNDFPRQLKRLLEGPARA